MMNANCWFGHGYFFNWPLGMIMGTLFWLFLISGIAYIIYRLLKVKPGHFYQKETPLDILKKKYANGEINSDEFEKRKTTIES